VALAARTFRIFVSSTFSDLKKERDALQARVFPKLREFCAQRGARFQAIDLRWGISSEASRDQQTMNICLGEIERCQAVTPRPNFIILLGDRYGWCPPPPKIPAAEFEQIRDAVTGEEQAFLDKWYLRDDNAQPPEYLLQPWKGYSFEEWSAIEKVLQEMLLRGALATGQPKKASGVTAKGHSPWKSLQRLTRSIQGESKEIDEHISQLDEEAQFKYWASATHQEIAAGALSPQVETEHVFAFFRHIEGLPEDSRAADFRDLDQAGRPDTNAFQRLSSLKAALDDALAGNVKRYTTSWTSSAPATDHIDLLCADVYSALKGVIERQLADLEKTDTLQTEIASHETFRQERSRFFTGRDTTLGAIKDFVAGTDGAVLVVLGAGGTGKTSLMAKAIEEVNIDLPAAEVVYRFLGTTPNSSTSQNLLESLCREMDRRYGREYVHLPGDYHELETEFISRLGMACAEKPLILFLDAVDQLFSQQTASSLTFIPNPLPDHVRIVLTARPGDMDAFLEQRQSRRLLLEPMSQVEGSVLLERWLKAAGRTLQETQRQVVLEGFRQSEGRPLYLKLAFEEARHWKSGPGMPPEQLALDITGIIQHNLLDRLTKEDNHGEALVSHVLGYLAASRYGLAEDELLDLLSRDPQVYTWFMHSVYHYPQDLLSAARDYLQRQGRILHDTEQKHFKDEDAAAKSWLDEVRDNEEELGDFLAETLRKPEGLRLPVVLWSRLYFDLEPFLSSTQAEGIALLGYYHRELGEVAKREYLAGGNEIQYHIKLADYFQARSDPSGTGLWDGRASRGLSELPYHLVHGKRWDAVCDVLTDLKFLSAKTVFLGPQPLINDYDLARCIGKSEPSLQVIQEALRLSAHILTDDPHQLASQLTGRLLMSDLPPVCRLLKGARQWDRPWMRPLTSALIQPGGALLRTMIGHRGPVDHVAFSPDGKQVISRSGDGTARIWDADTGDSLRVILDREVVERVWVDVEQHGLLKNDPTGQVRITKDYDTLHVLPEGEEAHVVMLVGHNHEVRTWAFSPDGSRLATGGEDHTVRIWDLTGNFNEQALEHPGGVTAVASTPDGTLAISGGVDGALRAWDLQTGAKLGTLAGHHDRINALAITTDSRRLLSASNDGTLKLWDISSQLELLSMSGHQGGVRALAMTSDGGQAISAGADKTLRAWDLLSGQERSCVEGPQSIQPAIALSPNGRLAAAAYRDRTVRVWDLEHSALVATCIGHLNTIQAVAFSPSGMQLVSAGDDQTLRIWDKDTGIEEAVLAGHWDAVRALAFARYNQLVSLARDDTLRVWDFIRGCALLQLGGRQVDPWRRSQSPAASRTGAAPSEPLGLSVNPDGRQLVSFYINDDTLRLWDLEHGTLVSAFTGDFVLSCCALSESAVIAGTRNGRVYLLRLDGDSILPVPVSVDKEEEVKPAISLPSVWQIAFIGNEKQALVDAGVPGAKSLGSCSVYRLVPTPAERLAPDSLVTFSGILTCPCGQESPLQTTIAFGGFFNALSKVALFCPRCSRDMLLIGETSQKDGQEMHWLMVMTTTGPSGMVVMPGTASGCPELQVDMVEPALTEGVDPD
jgi:WD40 repeat protein